MTSGLAVTNDARAAAGENDSKKRWGGCPVSGRSEILR